MLLGFCPAQMCTETKKEVKKNKISKFCKINIPILQPVQELQPVQHLGIITFYSLHIIYCAGLLFIEFVGCCRSHHDIMLLHMLRQGILSDWAIPSVNNCHIGGRTQQTYKSYRICNEHYLWNECSLLITENRKLQCR